MRYSVSAIPVLIFLFMTGTGAAQLQSFDEAKDLSAQTGKPILLEFVHDD